MIPPSGGKVGSRQHKEFDLKIRRHAKRDGGFSYLDTIY
jgi:hypothetical protein